MMKKIILLFSGLLISITQYSQTIVFEKVFNWTSWDVIKDCIPTDDNGYAILGTFGGQSIVLKLDSNGDSLWTYTIGPEGDAWLAQIIQSQNSDLLIASQINGNGSILRLNNAGDSISCIIYPYVNDDNYFSCMVELDNGNLIVTNVKEHNGGNYPPTTGLLCFNQEGELQWTNGFGDQFPFSMSLTDSQDLLITGVSDWWDQQIWIAKLDSSNNYIFSFNLDGGNGNQIIESEEGDIYTSVNGYSANGSYNAVKLDSIGGIEWKLYNNNGSDGSSYTVCQLKPNRFAIGGSGQGGIAIKVFEANGDSLSYYVYEDYNAQYAFRMFAKDEFLVVSGVTKDPDENRSIIIIKMQIDSIYTANKPINLSIRQPKPILYPNPASNVIEFTDIQELREPFTLKVYDISGKLRLTKYYGVNNVPVLNIESLESGNYLIKFLSKSRNQNFKLIVSR